MENQHREITGYRDLNEHEVACMNGVKELAIQVGDIVDKLGQMEETDKRWLAIGTTDLQKGFMALTRAIAKPTTF